MPQNVYIKVCRASYLLSRESWISVPRLYRVNVDLERKGSVERWGQYNTTRTLMRHETWSTLHALKTSPVGIVDGKVKSVNHVRNLTYSVDYPAFPLNMTFG